MKHTKRRAYTREKTGFKDYGGREASPYREWLEKTGDFNQDHEAHEPPEANPDILAETQGLYFHEPKIDENQMQQVKDAWKLLTDKQKQVLRLVGLEGKTYESCGAIMGISRGNVLDLIKRARKVITENNKNKS